MFRPEPPQAWEHLARITVSYRQTFNKLGCNRGAFLARWIYPEALAVLLRRRIIPCPHGPLERLRLPLRRAYSIVQFRVPKIFTTSIFPQADPVLKMRGSWLNMVPWPWPVLQRWRPLEA